MNSYFILNNNKNNDDNDISNSSSGSSSSSSSSSSSRSSSGGGGGGGSSSNNSSSSDSNKGRRIQVLTKEQDLLRSYMTSLGPCNKVVAPLVESCGLTGLRGLQIGKRCSSLYLNLMLHKLVSLLAFIHFNYYRL